MPTAPRQAALAFIFISVVLDVLALGVIIPVLPHLIEAFLGNDTAAASRTFGLFGGVWALMQFFCAPVLGALSDRFGRRPVLLASSFGLGFDYVLMALAPSIAWLFVGRVVSGLTAAGFSTAGAYIADVTPPDKRAAGFGMIGAAWGLGFVLGPALGGLLGELDARLPFWVAAALTLVNSMYGLFVLPESLPPERRERFSWKRANPIGSLRLLRSHSELVGLAAVNTLGYLAHHVLPSVFVLYTGYRYGWSERDVGLTLAVVGVCNMIVQGILVRPIVTKLGERTTLVLGLFFGAAAFVVYGAAPTSGVFLLGVPIGAFMGLYSPAVQALMTKRVGPAEQGQLQGAGSSLIGITGLFGPFLFTQVFAYAIDPAHSAPLAGAPFWLAAALMALAMPLAARVTRRASAAAAPAASH